MVHLQYLMEMNPLNQQWIWDEFLTIDEYKTLYKVCKYFREVISERKDYWKRLFMHSWWYQGFKAVYPLNSSLAEHNFTKDDYFKWKDLYQIVKGEMNPILFLTCIGKKRKKVKIFGSKKYHISRYWSYFHMGVLNIPFTASNATDVAIELIHSHGFTIEIPCDRKNCRAFIRDQRSLEAYFSDNLIRLKSGLSNKVIQ